MAKVRVYELAKELGVESKTLLNHLKDQGEFVRSASSTIEPPVVRKIRETFPAELAAGGKAAGGSAAKPSGAAPTPGKPGPRPAPAAPARPAGGERPAQPAATPAKPAAAAGSASPAARRCRS